MPALHTLIRYKIRRRASLPTRKLDRLALQATLALAAFLLLGANDLLAQRSSPIDRPANLSGSTPKPGDQVLKIQQAFDRYDFWDNRDSDWFGWQIPLFECPDRDLTEIYYYRWELATKHLVYGSPLDGYASTEFIDRPFWSGTYGAISCPAGHQIQELRWLRSPEIARDYARYWFRTPGAEPRNYSCWLAAAILDLHHIHPDRDFLIDLLDDLLKNHQGWVDRHWSESEGMFWQTGHDDGMELNINSRQTPDPLRGAPGFRPTLNSYLYADALAIATVCDWAGRSDQATALRQQAARVRSNIQQRLWDPDRSFFLQKFLRDETHEGHTIQAGSLTHQTGRFAGSPHGRELIGYVPWQFSIPEPGKGYEEAWRFLVDAEYFQAPFGPRSVERNDPMYLLSKSCCFWSGQSWPYATAQTLQAMANVLRQYDPKVIDAEDYRTLLRTYAKTHRKDGKPYLAEACNPDTGSWEGHDGYNHSEHYFHSCYVDLILSDLIGILPEDNAIVLHPLADPKWDWWAVDNLVVHGSQWTILWDSDGTRYGKGKGWQVFRDGKLVHRSDRVEPIRLDAASPAADAKAPKPPRPINVAVNNSLSPFPEITVNSSAPGTRANDLNDGNSWYLQHPPNRWASDPDQKDQAAWLQIDFGMPRAFETVGLYLLDDGPDQPIQAPAEVRVEIESSTGQWQVVATQVASSDSSWGHRPLWIELGDQRAQKVKIVLTPRPGRQIGLSEVECWSRSGEAWSPAPGRPGNLAVRVEGAEFPKISASFTSPYDRADQAIDGLYSLDAKPHNRWTSWSSKTPSDWLELDFGTPKTIARMEFHFYDDRGGVQPPESFLLEGWIDGVWQPLKERDRNPRSPSGGRSNQVLLEPVTLSKVRATFQHRGESKTGLTEWEIWGPETR